MILTENDAPSESFLTRFTKKNRVKSLMNSRHFLNIFLSLLGW